MKLPRHTFVGAGWNKFKMNSHDMFANSKHRFGSDGYGKVGVCYSDRDADSNYIFAGSKRMENGSAMVTGLGTDIRQKASMSDTSYSQPLRPGNTASEFVVGMDYDHFESTTEQGRSASVRDVALGDFHSASYVNLLQQAHIGTRGHDYPTSKEDLDGFGLYGKTVFRPVDGLPLIAGGRVGHYKIETGGDMGLNKTDKTKLTGYAGVVHSLNDINSLCVSFPQSHTPQTSLGADGELLKVRQGNQFEVGYKGSYMDEYLNICVSFYHMQDENAAASTVGNSIHYAVLGKRVMEGVKIEISGVITPK